MKALLLLLPIMALSCFSSVDIHVKNNTYIPRPNKMLIGYFEKRNLSFNPFISKDFRDALQFEFFKRGFAIELLVMEKPSPQNEHPEEPTGLEAVEIKKYLGKQSADLFIQGTLSERTFGDALKTETSCFVLISLHTSDGEKVCEARYMTSDTLANSEIVVKIASTMAEKISARFSGR